MFQTHEVEEILKVVKDLTDDPPSKSTLEWLARVANEPDWTVAALCLAIKTLAATGKLAPGEEEEEENEGRDNDTRAETLQNLMRLLGEEEAKGRRRRAYALRTINKLCNGTRAARRQ